MYGYNSRDGTHLLADERTIGELQKLAKRGNTRQPGHHVGHGNGLRVVELPGGKWALHRVTFSPKRTETPLQDTFASEQEAEAAARRGGLPEPVAIPEEEKLPTWCKGCFGSRLADGTMKHGPACRYADDGVDDASEESTEAQP